MAQSAQEPFDGVVGFESGVSAIQRFVLNECGCIFINESALAATNGRFNSASRVVAGVRCAARWMPYRLVLPCAFAFLQRALAMAASLAFAAALMCLPGIGREVPDVAFPLIFAHLALAEAAILALAATLIVLLARGAGPLPCIGEPKISAISL